MFCRAIDNVGPGMHDRGASANEMDAAQGVFIGFVRPGYSKLHAQ